MGIQSTLMQRETKIMNVLKREGLFSTTKISVISGLNYYVVEDILKDLYERRIISKKSNGQWTYWYLRENYKKDKK